MTSTTRAQHRLWESTTSTHRRPRVGVHKRVPHTNHVIMHAPDARYEGPNGHAAQRIEKVALVHGEHHGAVRACVAACGGW